MAEYSREQRNQLSRAVANSNFKSRQLKEFADNRHSVDLIIQCKCPNMLECETEISYEVDIGHKMLSKETGKNCGNDADAQKIIIGKHPQTKWIISTPEKGNKHGVCAEPHSLAKALLPTINDEKNIKKIYSVRQTLAKFVKLPKIYKDKGYNKGDVYPSCKTCEQWVPRLGEIKSADVSTS